MKRSLLALGLLVSATPAMSEPLESQMLACRAKTIPAERLECLDAIPLAAPPTTDSVGTGRWIVDESRSPLDDSPLVTATLPTSSGATDLVFAVRCKEGRTEAFVSANQPIGFSQTIEVQYRMGQAPAVRADWAASTTGRGAFAPRGTVISVVRAIPAEGTMFVRVRGQVTILEASYETRGVDEVRRKVAAACRWPAEGARPSRPSPPARPGARQ